MLTGFPLALTLLAQAPAAAPVAATTPAPAATPAAPRECGPEKGDSERIVICGQRPQGYRIDPDILEAKRETKRAGRPRRQATEGPPPDCRTVGPAPCMTGGVNIIGAALTAAEMAKRLASGQEIGSMFVTDPQPSEYQLYQMAKARREAAEAEKAAIAKRRAAQAAQAGQAGQATAK